MKPTQKILTVAILLSGVIIRINAEESKDFTDILESEIQREFDVLKNQSPAAHYIDYRVEDSKSWYVSTFMGALTNSDSRHNSYVNTVVRVGDTQFDNTHPIKGIRNRTSGYSRTPFPIEGGEQAIRQLLWKITDDEYNSAKGDYLAKKNKLKVEDENPTNDFSESAVTKHYEEPLDINISKEFLDHIAAILQEASAEFKVDPDIMQGWATFNYSVKRKYFVSSEGHKVVQNFPMTRISIRGSIRSEEGNEMRLYKSFDSFSPDDLPSKEVLINTASAMVKKLIKLKEAPLAKPFTGPAILSPSAAGVFFHEIFGHRIEGHRLKDESDAQTFKNKVGEEVLPKTFNVYFDPQIKTYKDFDLNGYYQYDDQGVKGGKVDIVKNGVLNEFLMCRTPIEGFPKSNGHGRGDIYRNPVTRQSNMFISSSKPYSEEELRKMLLKQCKKQGLEYGYYFKEVTGGFTQTGRYMPNAFNVTPNEVYRIYADGRPDELVRGVDLIGTPLSMFSTILAAGTEEGLFNGFCGAESGSVPVSSISPAILVGKIETQKKSQKFSTGTVLPPPAE